MAYDPTWYSQYRQDVVSVRFDWSGTRLLTLQREFPPTVFNIHENRALYQLIDDTGAYSNSVTMKSGCFLGHNDEVGGVHNLESMHEVGGVWVYMSPLHMIVLLHGACVKVWFGICMCVSGCACVVCCELPSILLLPCYPTECVCVQAVYIPALKWEVKLFIRVWQF